MNYNEYQQEAWKTAVFGEDWKTYLPLALVGEAGEICNVIKKEIRNQAVYTEKILDETGDVLWYLAALGCCARFDLEELLTEGKYWGPKDPVTIAIKLTGFCVILAEHIWGLEPDRYALYYARPILLTLRGLWSQYHLTPEQVMAFNLAKLTERSQQGHLKHA